MAPLPKPPGQRARRNKDTVPWQVIELQEMSQPELPEGRPWCQETRDWWALWGGSAQGKYFGPTDWAALLDTARIHHAYWTSEGRAMLDHAAELRLELARFGAAPADRLRLRIQFATAEETEARAAKAQKGQSARDRREPLKALAELPADDTEAG
jgi:hypothetical protein